MRDSTFIKLIEACEKGDLRVYLHYENDYALQIACYHGHLQIVKYLVRMGANIQAEGKLAIEWATVQGHNEVVDYLEKRLIREKLEAI
jgi:ankyrin repeat protein